ncbi:MAG: ribonuclease J1 [Erysipelotrichaceae bacterium]
MEKEQKPRRKRRKPAPSQTEQQETNNVPVQHNAIEPVTVKKTDTKVIPLGGLGEVGKNMTIFEHEDEIIIVDAGIRFPEDSLLGVDYVIPDYSYLAKNAHKKISLIITHGHEDHIGGIPFLMKVIKLDAIYAPRFACSLIRKKLDERKLLKQAKLIEINASSNLTTKHFVVGFFNTVHSIPDSLGIIINTPNGRVVHTGDFKFDLTPIGGRDSDYQIMAYMGQIGVTLLMSDSTNSGVEDFSISERRVAAALRETTSKATGRLIVATFASNVHRVQQILEAAVSCGRKVIVFGRSMENVVEIGRKIGTINIPDSSFLTVDQLNHTPADKVCIVCTGSQGEPLAALSRIANGTHRHIRLIPNDTVVFSSSPIPGNSHSVNQVVNKLFRAGANVLTNSILNDLHTTGHASQEEQKLLLQLIKPKYFMPVHGEYKMLRIHGQTGVETGVPEENIITASNGDVIIMRNEQVIVSNERVQADAIYVDGNDSSGVSTAVIKDRQILSDSGLVSVVIAIDSRTNTLLSRPVIVTRGFVFIKESQTLLKEAETLVHEALKDRMQKRTTFAELKNTIRSTLEPFLYKKTHRNPIVIPVILNSKEAIAEMQNNRNKKNNNQKAKPVKQEKTA